MSLQLWMPLMGDLRNQGLGDYSISTLGTLSWVTGKLGSQAMRAGDGTQVVNGIRIEDTFTNLLNGNYSVSVWIKPYGQHVHYNGSIFSSGDWNKTNKRWAFGVSQDNSKVDVLCMNYNTYITCSVPENEWTHLVCARGDDDIVKLYKNGQYIGERNCSSDAAFDSDATFSCIGRESYANGYFSFNGAIQDFRLYNHCLSPMEIKKLSQGLVLHYPMNRQGWGQENLLPNTDFNGSSKKFTLNSGTEGGFTFTPTVTIPANTTYTVSCRLRGNANMNLYRLCTGGNESTPWVNRSELSTTDYQRYSITFSSPNSNKTLNQLYICTRYGTANSQVGDWFEIEPKSLKFEIGSIATSWCPSSADTLYFTMGLNNNIEYDCSGYCNNGSKMTNTITYTSDTAKYAVSTHFNGTYDGILIENLALKDIINSAVTYAFWIKPESESGARSVYFGSYSTGPSWSIEKTAGNVMRSYWNGSPDETCTGATITDGVWQHVCLTKSGTNDIKVYINGIQKWASTATHSNLNFPTTFRIGRDTRSNDGTPYKGLMSDFRIYATALSADDVKSLYQNCATIDPDGTIRGQIRS